MDNILILDPQNPTAEELAAYGKAAEHPAPGVAKIRHIAYDDSVEVAEEMAPHAFGSFPEEKLATYTARRRHYQEVPERYL